MGEPLAASANHLARDIDAEDLLETPGERLQQPAGSTADLQNALAPLQNFRHAFEQQLRIPLPRLPKGGLVLRIVTGNGLVGILLRPHIPIALHVEAAHEKVTVICVLKKRQARKMEKAPQNKCAKLSRLGYMP